VSLIINKTPFVALYTGNKNTKHNNVQENLVLFKDERREGRKDV
jgi:hypothetical protein